MKEIGGYFGLERFTGKEYYDSLISLNTGRNALAYLLKSRTIKKIYIPYFLCDSVSSVCQREDVLYEYYHINADFSPKFEKTLKDDEWIYVVNYYGQISNPQLGEMKIKWKNVIFDNVQAFFQKPLPDVDTIYSCRKFFGVPDGAYLSTNALLKECLDTDFSKERMKHVLGRLEGKASDYYTDFKSNDHSFKQLELRSMSELTHNLLRAINYESVRQKRNENYQLLDSALNRINGISFKRPDGPYCYPFYCTNGMDIKKILAKKNIYIATLWPNVLEQHDTLEKNYAENILPIPCDQRYTTEDMQRIILEIKKLSV